MARVLFIAGIPAAGKSSFCDWLEARHGFLHLDAEKPVFQLTPFWPLWQRVCNGEVASVLVDPLVNLGPPITFNWGFPPQAVALVERLVNAGMEPWWFGGDWGAAEDSFLQRDSADHAAFLRQRDALTTNWVDLEPIFEGRVLHTVSFDGHGKVVYQSAVDTWAAIEGA